jgi:hypothetical protein
MAFNNEMTYAERRILCEHILASDKRYFEKLYRRKLELMLEFQALEVSLSKKQAEMEGMQQQLNLLNMPQ